jgi:zinc/manganese transport system substrate-binding protein
MRAPVAIAVMLVLAGALSACRRSGPSPAARGGSFEVLAAENVWGSIAQQLAGDAARVGSIIVSPEADPHSYQPSAADARAVARASMLIVNGLGYDEWATQLARASPAGGRVLLDVGKTLRLATGANPHRWYYPADVRAVADAITAAYRRLDPARAVYFGERRRLFEERSLAVYDRLRAQIRARYAGVPVGYSESIFEGLGEDLHLRLLTPYAFAKSVSEGSEVSAADKRTVDAQASERRIAVWVVNSQNVTPQVQRVSEVARARHIPIATITETLAPASDSFEQWQVSELERLERALHEATGR